MTDVATFIKVWEGLKLKTYLDSGGVPSIGYGHTGVDVKPGMEITPDRADILLQHDIDRARALVTQYIEVPLNENQMTALISLVFNCGVAPLKGTLGHLLNGEHYDTASMQFLRWVHDNGKVLTGLVRRRTAEQKLFNTPTNEA